MDRKILLILIVASVLSVQFIEVSARGRGGGGRYRSGGSRSRSSSTTRRSTTRRHFSPAGSSRVYKHTPIPVYTSKSPVIIKQTKPGSRSNLARNAFFGYMLYRYSLMRAPVYRSRYPIHRSTVEIPDERAIRLSFIEEIMLDSVGQICLNSSKNYTLVSDKNERVSHVFTSVRYSDLYGGKAKEYFGDNQTVSVDMNALDQSVEISTIVKYNGTIVANTNCTQIKSVLNGTVVRMYATNPDGAVSVQSSFLVVILSSFIYCVI